MTVHCAKCAHEWDIHLENPMLLDRFVDILRTATKAGCPKCLASGLHVLLGPTPVDSTRE